MQCEYRRRDSWKWALVPGVKVNNDSVIVNGGK